MSDFNVDEYIESQKASWNDAARGWEKWDRLIDANMSSLNGHLLERAMVSEGHNVLDLGSGTGYPALASAVKVGDTGQVTGFDLSEEMLNVARKKSAALGVSNVEFHACDVCVIPRDDETFNAVTSRFCLMFLPDVNKALREARRVLKKDGRISAAVWADMDKNPSLSLPVKIISEYVDMPAPNPSQPGIFSLAAPGSLKSGMEKAGFKNVDEQEVRVEWRYESPAQYVDCMKDMAAPLRTALGKLPPKSQAEVEEKLLKAAEKYSGGDGVLIPGVAIIASGVKGAA